MMIQDIAPKVYKLEYRDIRPQKGDTVLYFNSEGKILTGNDGNVLTFPDVGYEGEDTVYLFSIDDDRFFLYRGDEDKAKSGWQYRSLRDLREWGSGPEVFAAFTAYHLWKWYSDNRFCGKCRSRLTVDTVERALVCGGCGQKIYPRINPAVIVGVLKGDKILVTRYKRGFSHDALIAGFAEIGETLEDTVRREVMEEAGIRVRNIRYYRSQPWGMAQDLLVGFFCEADGDDEIRMDEGELSMAVWKGRDEVEILSAQLSLTNEMMTAFKENRI